ncbi:MAG TPA: cupin domain-containing protein [Thermoanaerobacterales bacterium]|nr:cupin domain-containing protein [Thermoanaerobacterales bacterium]
MPFIDASSIKGVKVTSPPELRRINKVFVAPDINKIAKDVLIGQCIFEPYCKSDMHTHLGVEMIYVLSGKGKSRVGEENIDLVPDRLVIIPPGVLHDFENTENDRLKLLFIMTPPEKAEDIYNRAVKAAQSYSLR